MRKIISIILTILIISILLLGVMESPKFGDEDTPSNNYLAKGYIDKGVRETGALNIVTGIILDYRAFDTFVEATVLFSAVIVVILVLKKEE